MTVISIPTSENIYGIEWNEDTNELFITFVDKKAENGKGSTYKYSNVTEDTINEITIALNDSVDVSIGKTIRKLIILHPEKYPFEKVVINES